MGVRYARWYCGVIAFVMLGGVASASDVCGVASNWKQITFNGVPAFQCNTTCTGADSKSLIAVFILNKAAVTKYANKECGPDPVGSWNYMYDYNPSGLSDISCGFSPHINGDNAESCAATYANDFRKMC